MAGYLPMFSMAGVIAFMRTRKKGKDSWLTKAIIVFGIMACVPILNSSFVLFNASYYARWYYMPILLMPYDSKGHRRKQGRSEKGFVPVCSMCDIYWHRSASDKRKTALYPMAKSLNILNFTTFRLSLP